MSYLKKNMKFGIEVPTSVDHALNIDKPNGNTFLGKCHYQRNERCAHCFQMLKPIQVCTY